MQPAIDTPTATIHALTRPEHLLVWAMRAVALGHEDDPIVVRTFRHACGEGGMRTLDAYCMFVRCVAGCGRARLKVHAPGCPCVSEDEFAVVSSIAAAQHSLTLRDEARLRRALQDLLGGAPGEPLVFLAQAIARFLDDAGHHLPLRDAEAVREERPVEFAAARVLH